MIGDVPFVSLLVMLLVWFVVFYVHRARHRDTPTGRCPCRWCMVARGSR